MARTTGRRLAERRMQAQNQIERPDRGARLEALPGFAAAAAVVAAVLDMPVDHRACCGQQLVHGVVQLLAHRAVSSGSTTIAERIGAIVVASATGVAGWRGAEFAKDPAQHADHSVRGGSVDRLASSCAPRNAPGMGFPHSRYDAHGVPWPMTIISAARKWRWGCSMWTPRKYSGISG